MIQWRAAAREQRSRTVLLKRRHLRDMMLTTRSRVCHFAVQLLRFGFADTPGAEQARSARRRSGRQEEGGERKERKPAACRAYTLAQSCTCGSYFRAKPECMDLSGLAKSNTRNQP
eukprot:3938315-Rhodomonas_salina.1